MPSPPRQGSAGHRHGTLDAPRGHGGSGNDHDGGSNHDHHGGSDHDYHDEPEPEFTRSEENAIRSAEAFLDYTSFSRSGLIDQLEYEGFTTEQATYGVDKTGLTSTIPLTSPSPPNQPAN